MAKKKDVVVSDGRYNERQLRGSLAAGPAAIRSKLEVLKRRLSDAKFREKWRMYRQKQAQLEHLLTLNINPPAVPEDEK